MFATALWWGSLTAVGAWVVPLLFANLPSSALAGQTAARLFAAQTWVALACGLMVLMAQPRHRVDAGRGLVVLWVAGGMLLALVSEHAVAPRILARDNLPLWHSVGTLMFVGQWACAGMALWRLSAPRPVSPAGPS